MCSAIMVMTTTTYCRCCHSENNASMEDSATYGEKTNATMMWGNFVYFLFIENVIKYIATKNMEGY